MQIRTSLTTAAISSILKIPGSIGRYSDTQSLSPDTKKVVMKREAVNIGLNGIGAFFIDALLKKGLNQAIENPKIKPFIPLITILPIYIATEFVSRWIYPVADAIDSEVHAHQQPLMPLTFPEDKADVAISTHNSRDIHLSQWQRFHSQHMSPSVVYQA